MSTAQSSGDIAERSTEAGVFLTRRVCLDMGEFRRMRLEYLEDLESQTPRVLLAYGNDPCDAMALRRAAELLAAGEVLDVRVDLLQGFQAVDGCSLTAFVASVDSGVEPVDGSDRGFRCLLRPVSWTRVAQLLEPFEKPDVPSGFQYLTETGSIEWIVSRSRSW